MIGLSPACVIQALAGGLLIGLAAALMLLGLGRIAGVSGLIAQAISPSTPGSPRGAALLFLLGLLGTPAVAAMAAAALAAAPPARFPPSLTLLVVAGLLVGVGTRLGSGCTSGHGVCGVSRLSPRSLTATAVFMAAGIATAAVADRLGWAW